MRRSKSQEQSPSVLKTRRYTGSLKVSENDMDYVISVLKQYPYYAYILHDKDTENGKLKDLHYHFYIEFPNPRSVNSVAEDLGVEPHYLEKVRFPRNHILQYLTHENDPEKYHYNHEDIVYNIPDSWFISEDSLDLSEELSDFMKVRNGFMTPQEFVKRYNMYCATLSFYTRISLYAKLVDHSSAARGPVRAAGRSSTTEVVEQTQTKTGDAQTRMQSIQMSLDGSPNKSKKD